MITNVGTIFDQVVFINICPAMRLVVKSTRLDRRLLHALATSMAMPGRLKIISSLQYGTPIFLKSR